MTKAKKDKDVQITVVAGTNKTVDLTVNVNKQNVSTLEEYGAVYNRLQSELNNEETLTALFKKQLGDCFAKHPEVLAVRWQQYTPYFNDGEPCEFGGPYEIQLKLAKYNIAATPSVQEQGDGTKTLESDQNEEDENEEGEYDDDDDEEDDNPREGFTGGFLRASYYLRDEKERKQYEKLQKQFDWICGIDNDFLLTMFDDHTEVTIDRNLKIKTTEYNHD